MLLNFYSTSFKSSTAILKVSLFMAFIMKVYEVINLPLYDLHGYDATYLDPLQLKLQNLIYYPRIISIIYDGYSDNNNNTTLSSGGVSILQTNHISYNFTKSSIPHGRHKQIIHWHNSLNGQDYDEGHKCQPMYDWQVTQYPSCNMFHEIYLNRMRVINTGGVRIAFEMNEQLYDGKEQKFVFKTLKYNHPINYNWLELQRRDGIVLEKLANSKFIPDMYGFCNTATFMDYMPDGNMHDYVKGARLAGGSTLSTVDLLKLSIHVSSGVADLHTIDGTETPSFFHNDICCHQFLYQDGIFKLNDFHSARPIYVKSGGSNDTKVCPVKGFGVALRKYRSPEEHMIFQKKMTNGVNPDAVDVFMMGNLLYLILTGLYIFEKPYFNVKEAGKELVEGRRSHFPDHILSSNDTSIMTMKKAIEMSWVHNWKERSPARSISDYLMAQLVKVTGEEDPDLRVVLPERDPNQAYTSSDFNKVMYGVSKTAKQPPVVVQSQH